jgi:hypothetical protein
MGQCVWKFARPSSVRQRLAKYGRPLPGIRRLKSLILRTVSVGSSDGDTRIGDTGQMLANSSQVRIAGKQ